MREGEFSISCKSMVQFMTPYCFPELYPLFSRGFFDCYLSQACIPMGGWQYQQGGFLSTGRVKNPQGLVFRKFFMQTKETIKIWDYKWSVILQICNDRSYKKVLKFDMFTFPFTEIDLKKAAKLFANKFSCGSSVTGDDEIVIQGDFSYDVIELIQSHWPEVN